MQTKVKQGNEDKESVIQWRSFKWLNLSAEGGGDAFGCLGKSISGYMPSPWGQTMPVACSQEQQESQTDWSREEKKESTWAQQCHWAAHPVGTVHFLGEGVSHWQHLRRWALSFHWYPNSIFLVAVLRIEWGCKGRKGETSKKALAKIIKRNDCGLEEDGCNTVYEKWWNARSVYDMKQ